MSRLGTGSTSAAQRCWRPVPRSRRAGAYAVVVAQFQPEHTRSTLGESDSPVGNQAMLSFGIIIGEHHAHAQVLLARVIGWSTRRRRHTPSPLAVGGVTDHRFERVPVVVVRPSQFGLSHSSTPVACGQWPRIAGSTSPRVEVAIIEPISSASVVQMKRWMFVSFVCVFLVHWHERNNHQPRQGQGAAIRMPSVFPIPRVFCHTTASCTKTFPPASTGSPISPPRPRPRGPRTTDDTHTVYAESQPRSRCADSRRASTRRLTTSQLRRCIAKRRRVTSSRTATCSGCEERWPASALVAHPTMTNARPIFAGVFRAADVLTMSIIAPVVFEQPQPMLGSMLPAMLPDHR